MMTVKSSFVNLFQILWKKLARRRPGEEVACLPIHAVPNPLTDTSSLKKKIGIIGTKTGKMRNK